ncbi:hypothetical protein K470DRAFT_254274 [Piedraia hortae CBS 480.64]|uniref:Shugoshin C-terminal domain-containing protein n=1 Tax=Piedraia hortae CBS 480.64 TaxID=1314780 RepID=A0A6A7CAD7_9PEZI|nr:hypothetical protein K470DRAFT_254274 [Piedraia hortae CBS 480.64]
MARLNGERPAAPAMSPTPASQPQFGEVADHVADIMRTKGQPLPDKTAPHLDEIRRKVIRQNRELAKNNSHQNLRIRGLEMEIGRLQTDNLALREKILQLENELRKTKSAPSEEVVRSMKVALQAKLAELDSIVDGLDQMAALHSNVDGRVTRSKEVTKRLWLERRSLRATLGEKELPTICEGKQYPRRTLNSEEIQKLRLSDPGSNDSPDLGPPPMAHFDFEDPVKAPASPSVSYPAPAVADGSVLPDLGVNLETRRRRKDGLPKLEIRRQSIVPSSPERTDGEASCIIRAGAKRKMIDRDVDEDFSFSRKTQPAEEKKSVPGVSDNSAKGKAENVIEPALAVNSPAVRKVLGDKSVNISPRKAPVRASQVETALDKPDKSEKPNFSEKSNPPEKAEKAHAKKPARGTSRSVSSIPLLSPQRNSFYEPAEIELPEPSSKEPSQKPSTKPEIPASRSDASRTCTPQPEDLSSASIKADGGGRPSRRAKGAVNYAEPSLIAKMRRPGEQMVDAISGLQKHQSVMKKEDHTSVPIKEEAAEDGFTWKDLPTTSSEKKSSASKRTRKPNPTNGGRGSTPSSPTVSKSAPTSTVLDAATKELEDLAIYDVAESSSPGPIPEPVRSKSTSSRRHSTASKSGTKSSKDLISSGEGSERAANRRRTLMQ